MLTRVINIIITECQIEELRVSFRDVSNEIVHASIIGSYAACDMVIPMYKLTMMLEPVSFDALTHEVQSAIAEVKRADFEGEIKYSEIFKATSLTGEQVLEIVDAELAASNRLIDLRGE